MKRPIGRRPRVFLFVTLIAPFLVPWTPTSRAAETRGVVIENFESGAVVLGDYPGQNQQPDRWELTGTNVWEGSYALRIYGNTWKTQAIGPRSIDASTVWQVAVRVENRGEMSAFGVSDGTNELFYVFAGSELPTASNWWTVYQGAFPLSQWYVYHLPIGEDWYATHGYYPVATGLVYVNDDDAASDVVTVFDAVVDITEDLPVPPVVTAAHDVRRVAKVSRDLYRADVQFTAEVFDPDSETHEFFWDFGDSSSSTEQNPAHTYLVHADYSYTVAVRALDPDGCVGFDTCHVNVEPGPGDLPITVNFVGDVMTARTYEYSGGIIDTYGVEAIFAPTRPILGDAADVSVANLECAYTNQGTPHPTKLYTFRSRPENIAGVVSAGIDLVNLANNHALDYGVVGMQQTCAVLDSVGILRFGCGMNDTEALRPVFWTERGLRVAFLGLCDRTEREYNHQPFPDAGANKPGFAYLVPKNLAEAVPSALSQADVLVVTMHSGIEYEPEPPPGKGANPPDVESAEAEPAFPVFRFRNEPTQTERATRRLALDLGADIVINHHPHVLQGFESYEGKLIAHSLGNFVMDLSYVETFPTLVLTLAIDTGGIAECSIVPAWIDNLITQPASGRLGREILDRMADYSRPMGALVAVDVEDMRARIYADPSAPLAEVSRIEGDVALAVEGGYAVSEPLELAGRGTLSRIVSVDGVAPGAWEVSWGREILWHGSFEAEGATFWDTNTSDEWLDDTVSHTGERSLTLRRRSTDTQSEGTDLEKHLPCDPGRRHSFTGWMKGERAAGANILGRFYSSRTGATVLGDTQIGPSLEGTRDWYGQWKNMNTPSNGYYFEVRCTLSPPASGEARAWFDDLAFIEWEPWQAGSPDLEVEHPNNYRFLQVRTTDTGIATAAITYEETRYGVEATATADLPAATDARPCLVRNFPNPFNPATKIVLAVPAGEGRARAHLAVYDVQGRLVAVLFDDWVTRGVHQEIVWDGVDDRGRAVPSGVYFCRAVVDGRAESTKLVLLK